MTVDNFLIEPVSLYVHTTYGGDYGGAHDSTPRTADAATAQLTKTYTNGILTISQRTRNVGVKQSGSAGATSYALINKVKVYIIN